MPMNASLLDASPIPATADALPESQPQSMPPAAQAFYRPELDGLRFFAFLAVYVNHVVQFGNGGHHHHMPDAVGDALGTVGVAGAFGVDLFFVLSAYLITELLLRERRGHSGLDVKAFYIRRVLRIWPLYFTFLAIAYALTFVWPHEQLSSWHLLGFAFFSGNWVYMYHPVATVAAPLWSVSVEEQFYLAWPWAVRRGGTNRIIFLAIALVGLGMVVRFTLGRAGINEPWISKNSLARVDGIAGGVLLAALLRGRMPRLGRWGRVGLLCGSIAILLGVAHECHLFDGPISPVRLMLGWPLVAVGCVGIVVAALGRNGPLSPVLESAPLIYLGRISFGLYVFHQLGLLGAERVFPRYSTSASQWLGHTALGLLLTLPMAMASYRWIEQPFLRLKQRRFTLVRSRPETT